MSNKMLRISTSDLQIVRVKCKGTVRPTGQPCHMTYEVAMKDLPHAFPQNLCPVCGMNYAPDGTADNVLRFLSEAFGSLASMTNKLQVEFDLPFKDA